MKYIQKYFWLVILLSLVLGYCWVEPGLYLKNWLTWILMAMMTMSCLKIDLKKLKNFKHDWWRYVILLFNIFFVLTLLVSFFQKFLSPDIYLGLILVAACPCGISVVAFSIAYGGQPSKALIITALANLLAPIFIPTVVWLFVHKIIHVDTVAMFWLVFKLVVIPIFLAEIIKYLKWNKYLENYITGSNAIFVGMLNWAAMASVAGVISWQNKIFWLAMIIVLLITFLEVFLGYLFGRNREEKVTWSIANFYKNTGLTTVIALASFNSEVLLGVVAYIIVTNVILAPLQYFIGRRSFRIPTSGG